MIAAPSRLHRVCGRSHEIAFRQTWNPALSELMHEPIF